ncbi:helix-turn-helix domain-containing protein [Amycolatopsis benzoatilytica]|uniref:helix-turn-helix domain-containing protein n=1 Tax=Amycolatopsis benzoatilytica TaxID=346045 RepID=UPI00037AA604|nr:helix-turn-helix domain-containing protein [Amycolatopsis benzoatilytica]
MRELVTHLSALDPGAAETVKVIAYFDRLVESRAGLEPIVRGAAVLSGCPARLADDERRVRVRVEPDGRVLPSAEPPDPKWPSAAVRPDGPPALWLERSGPPSPVDAMVLERASAAARSVLDRTRGRTVDPASVEVVLDPAADEKARLLAAARLGLGATARAVVTEAGPQIVSPRWTPPEHARVGLGSVVDVVDLPLSGAQARTAFRFAAVEGDLGPSVVDYVELGGLAVLADVIGPGTKPIADVRALEDARTTATWVLPTLVAVAGASSLRAAATTLVLHHSTLQERLAHAEELLGWPVRDPAGRLRLQLAIALWRLHRTG